MHQQMKQDQTNGSPACFFCLSLAIKRDERRAPHRDFLAIWPFWMAGGGMQPQPGKGVVGQVSGLPRLVPFHQESVQGEKQLVTVQLGGVQPGGGVRHDMPHLPQRPHPNPPLVDDCSLGEGTREEGVPVDRALPPSPDVPAIPEGAVNGIVPVTPAKAGVQNQPNLHGFMDSRVRGCRESLESVVPAKAGTLPTLRYQLILNPCLRRGDEKHHFRDTLVRGNDRSEAFASPSPGRGLWSGLPGVGTSRALDRPQKYDLRNQRESLLLGPRNLLAQPKRETLIVQERDHHHHHHCQRPYPNPPLANDGSSGEGARGERPLVNQALPLSADIPATPEGVVNGIVPVTPTKAGIQNQPNLHGFMDSRVRGNDKPEDFASPSSWRGLERGLSQGIQTPAGGRPQREPSTLPYSEQVGPFASTPIRHLTAVITHLETALEHRLEKKVTADFEQQRIELSQQIRQEVNSPAELPEQPGMVAAEIVSDDVARTLFKKMQTIAQEEQFRRGYKR